MYNISNGTTLAAANDGVNSDGDAFNTINVSVKIKLTRSLPPLV